MNRLAPPVLIMAGGTGGHIFPGLAVADALRARGVGVRWLGARGGMECGHVARHGIGLDVVRISAVRGTGLAGWLAMPFRLFRAVLDARASLNRNPPACAVSFGGYAAGPGGIAAWLRGVPLIVHEQNRIPGMTNRFLARIAVRVLQAFPGTFPPGANATTCGNPVRTAVAALPEPQLRFAGRSGPPRVLVTGGSQGAQRLNRVFPQAAALLNSRCRPVIRHQAGRQGLDETRAAYAAAGVDAEVVEFIDDIAQAYAWADLVVGRAGALTVSELAAAGLGGVLVPFPFAVDDHQTRNAEFLEQAGAAHVVPERGLTPESLAGILAPLLASRQQLLTLAEAARKVGIRESAQLVAAECESWLDAGGEEGRE